MKIGFLSQMDLKGYQDFFPNEKLPEAYKSEIFVPLIRHYLDNGHEVVICTLNLNSIRSSLYKSGNLTIFVAGTLIKAKLRAATGFRYEIAEMVKFFKNNPCDVYHANWTYEFAMAALEVDAEKTLITIHDWPEKIYQIYNDYYRRCRLRLAEKVFEKGINFTAVSPYIEDLFKAKYPTKNLVLIPNYTDFNEKDLTVSKKLSDEAPTILSISTFDKCKNTEIIMKAFKQIRCNIPKAKLRLIGAGHGIGEKGYRWAVDNGCTAGVEFMGSIPHDDVIRELKRGDLLIHTSHEESFGIVLIEAMYCKTPVIAGANSGAVPWVLDNGVAGRLIDVTDVEAICSNTVEILSNSELWNKYVEAGVKRVRDFTLDNISGKYLREYEKLKDTN